MKHQRLFSFMFGIIIALLACIMVHNFIMAADIYNRMKNHQDNFSSQLKTVTEDFNNKVISVEKSVQELRQAPTAKDGRDGADGKDGADSIGTHTIVEKQVPVHGRDGADGINGKTPQLKCDTKENAWMVRYSSTEDWQFLNAQEVKCTGF